MKHVALGQFLPAAASGLVDPMMGHYGGLYGASQNFAQPPLYYQGASCERWNWMELELDSGGWMLWAFTRLSTLVCNIFKIT